VDAERYLPHKYRVLQSIGSDFMVQVGLGTGIGVAVLIGLVAYLLGLSFNDTVSLILLLAGLWTLVFGLLLADKDSRLYFSGWGVVVAIMSSFIVIPPNDAIALILIAIIAMIVVSVFYGSKRTGK
jgi:hypothetical protein